MHQIAGMGEAFAIAAREREQDFDHAANLNSQFLSRLINIKNLAVNGERASRSPYILNIRFDGMLADALIAQLPEIAVSTASACQGKGTEGSYVLRAMGLSDAETKSSIRVSFGRFSTADDIDKATAVINRLFL